MPPFGGLAAQQAAGEEALQSLEGQLGRTDRDALRAERQGLDHRAATLRDVQSLMREAAAASERIAEAFRLAAQASGQEAAAAAALADAQARLPPVDAALAEASRAYGLAMASASEGAEHLRATLRPG